MRLSHLAFLPIPSLLVLLPFHLVSAADSQLPALTDTSGINAPARPTTTQASPAATPKPTKASASSGAASTSANALSSTDLGGLQSGLPKIDGDYPAASVPPTANAPFMQKSNLPEGTVFICVGVALAFIALTILAWRGIVAWSLHRSVRRSAMAQSSKYTYIGDAKSSARGEPNSHLGSKLASPFAGSTLTLDQYAPPSTSGKGAKSPLSAPASRNSLFFSPTASHTAGNPTPGSTRASAYLPAGYYASNAPSAHTQPQPGISMSTLAPGSNRHSRHSRSFDPSPPPSSRGERPSTGGGLGSNMNLSTTALAGGQGGGSEGRAPSAFLEDLFDRGTDVVAAEQAHSQPQSQTLERAPERLPDDGGRARHERRRSGHHGGERRRSHTGEGSRAEGGRSEDTHRRERRRSSRGIESSSRRRDSRTMDSPQQHETPSRRRDSRTADSPQQQHDHPSRRRASRTAESPQHHRRSRVEREDARRRSGF